MTLLNLTHPTRSRNYDFLKFSIRLYCFFEAFSDKTQPLTKLKPNPPNLIVLLKRGLYFWWSWFIVIQQADGVAAGIPSVKVKGRRLRDSEAEGRIKKRLYSKLLHLFPLDTDFRYVAPDSFPTSTLKNGRKDCAPTTLVIFGSF